MNANTDLQLIGGPSRVQDAEVVRVGFFRNPALVEANAERDDIPEYRGTWIVTLAVAHEKNVDVLQDLHANGEDVRLAMITANINVNGEQNPRIPFEGEKIKATTIYPVQNREDGSPLLHGERSPLEGRQVFRARLEEFYPAKVAKKVNLQTLLTGEVAEEKPEAITQPSAE